jgi:N-acetylmuramoyl-L-alanine amidase
MKAAICIGHSRSGDNGAESVSGVSEWTFNRPIGEKVCDILKGRGVDVLFLDRYEGNGYSSSTTWAATQIDNFGADCAIEIHFNAASPSAEGFEYLYWATSSNGRRLAQSLLDSHAATYPDNTSRGIKPKTYADRGSGFLSKPRCPSVICEPFFGSHPDEWNQYSNEAAIIAKVYADGILDWFGIDTDEPTPEPPKPSLTIEQRLTRLESFHQLE